MSISDVVPANGPRFMLDGQLQLGPMTVPVLISASNHRLIILSSECLSKMALGLSGVLTPNGREPITITLGEIDRLSMIAQYELERVGSNEPMLPNP
jgi:hypothetical protein